MRKTHDYPARWAGLWNFAPSVQGADVENPLKNGFRVKRIHTDEMKPAEPLIRVNPFNLRSPVLFWF